MEDGSRYLRGRRRPLVAALALIMMLSVGLIGCRPSSDSTSADPSAESTAQTSTTTGEGTGDGAQDSAQTQTDGQQTDERQAAADAIDLSGIRIASEPEMYTYDDMTADLNALATRYYRTTSLDSLATTTDGREIYRLVIGNPDAQTQVFFTGGIHAREYLTSELVMEQAYSFLARYGDDEDLLDTFCIQVVPMSNPDGVTISQLGLDGLNEQGTRDTVMGIADMDGYDDLDSYLRRWKSNADGIDINRQFDADWDEYDDGVGHPSADHYKGTSPECTVEAKALADLTRTYMFDRAISYHTQGRTIYWSFGQTGQLEQDSLAFAQRISDETGYPLDGDYQALDAAGYKDWAVQTLGLVSITVEVGSGTDPLPADQYPQIWAANGKAGAVTLADAGVTLP